MDNDSPPIPDARPSSADEACLAELNAVLIKYGRRLVPTLQLQVRTPAAPGSPQVDAGAEDGS